MGASFQRRELGDLLRHLDNFSDRGNLRRGVLVLGGPGTGKSVMIRQLEAELQRQNRAVFVVRLGQAPDADIPTLIDSEIKRHPAYRSENVHWLIRSSSRRRRETTGLDRIAKALENPVLIIDGLDQAHNPQQADSDIEDLSYVLEHEWKLVVTSRPGPHVQPGQFSLLDELQLGRLTDADMTAMLWDFAPDLTKEVASAIVRLADGNPLSLRLLSQDPDVLGGGGCYSLDDSVDQVIAHALDGCQDQALLRALMEELTLVGGQARTSALAAKLRIPPDRVAGLLSDPPVRALFTIDQQADTVAFVHNFIQTSVLVQNIFQRSFHLDDLGFGAEEAERDDLLDATFVGQHTLNRILAQRRSLVIGDRGSGKSAIFRTLAKQQPVEILPVSNTGDLLHRIAADDARLDVDALRAAWLVLIAATVAGTIPDTAPTTLRHHASELRAALGLPTPRRGQARRTINAAARLLGDTKLKFGVGPVSFEATLPAGAQPSDSFLDAETLLQETDHLLHQADRRVVILLDRIDETFKYDRRRQEAMVQALLQAEARVSQFECIHIVVFLRTDLFELYDLQEKNKLVSRSLTIEWSDEDWLRTLIRRVFANEPLTRLAQRLHVNDIDIQTRAALEVLFPAQIENQPVRTWLVDSLRNGNGDISPRQAVLLLHLTRECSVRPDHLVSAVPLFSADALQRAMTKLSDLTFSEVVNDFKVAPTFLLNCRAGKLTSFTLSQVEHLFDSAEGKTSDQVRLLERLGFLERVVEQRGTQTTSMFRIPPLYTRCWDYAS